MASSTLSPDRINRTVLLAVELQDPVTLELVSRGIKVTAHGLTSAPIINLAGRFVWMAEGEAWPTILRVDAGDLPYESAEHAVPAKPVDFKKATEQDRLVRIVLRPTPAYAFESGVTSVRGRLLETADPTSPGVADADIWIRWSSDASGGVEFINAPVKARSNKKGDFAAFVRFAAGVRPALTNGRLVTRITVMRGNLQRECAKPLQEGRCNELGNEPLAWNDMT